jgi:16S rRNA C1402 (ribose-2'-O) methylase RsmI
LFELRDLWFNGKIFVAREISKMYEQIFNWNLDEIIDLVKSKKLPIKWEFVIGLY